MRCALKVFVSWQAKREFCTAPARMQRGLKLPARQTKTIKQNTHAEAGTHTQIHLYTHTHTNRRRERVHRQTGTLVRRQTWRLQAGWHCQTACPFRAAQSVAVCKRGTTQRASGSGSTEIQIEIAFTVRFFRVYFEPPSIKSNCLQQDATISASMHVPSMPLC